MTNQDNVSLDRIRALCKERGISVAKMARDLGFGEGAIYKWPKNQPSGERVARVAKYFNVSTDYLYGRTDMKQNPENLVETELISMQRAIQNLRPEDRKKANDILKAGFSYAFED